MKLGHLVAITERVLRRMQTRINGQRVPVETLPVRLQAVVAAGLGVRTTINGPELNLLLRSALVAIEGAAGGLFSKASADTEIDMAIARAANKRCPAALALVELALDRDRRKQSLGPLLDAQRARLRSACDDAQIAASSQHELARLFVLPLDQCLRAAAERFRQAEAPHAADELTKLEARLATHPDEVTAIAVRARTIMLTNAAVMSDAQSTAAAAVRDLERAASTLPELDA
jgi:hypothetical protein